MRACKRTWITRAARWAVCTSMVVMGNVALAASEDDPWEGVNRVVFRFNDTLDTYALEPVAQGYDKVTPDFLQTGISNVFNNIGEVRNLANDVLQGKPHAAGVDTARFLMNTTIGMLGFFDVASHAGLARNDEDFGQTFGWWGMKSGPYVVLPFFGPSTVRDTFGRIPDSYSAPYPYMNDVAARNTMMGLGIVDTRANLLDAEKMITGDKYIFIRNAYLQNREFRVQDGKVEDDF
ncbi:phospholipid-binding lipoprotein MlaA [Pseudomonas duriflava]|uniref:Phospholipid-binding lipoprotein MlaA n=1 Tax=Pseudomonas duriflava TaxID=459528 RepID=A0A562Q8U9_9PSED|nr:VacJ family lipoprotein [Pseudomonas duriflava]TWI53149.1 phospholipid-binding lipoprotein MlaA [Pseudomonas duriflava]